MKKWLSLLIGVLLLSTLACSLTSRGSEPDDNEGPVAVATESAVQDEPISTEEVVDDEPEGDDGVLAVDADAFSQLSTYRARIAWTIEKADGTGESFQMEQSATRDPAAQQFRMTSDGETIEFIQLGDQMYMRFGEEWMSTSSEDSSMSEFDDMLTSSDDWIADIDESDYTYLGKETVNDIACRHYQAEYREGWMGSFFSSTEGEENVEDGTVDVWIADESDLPAFVVRSVVEANGTFDGEAGTVTLSQDIYDVNAPFTIEAPEGVEAGGMPDGVEVYPGATDLTTWGTMTMFTSADSVATVNAFYEAALEGADWSQEEGAMVTDEVVSSSWSKDGESLSLMITSGDDGTSVIITMESGE